MVESLDRHFEGLQIHNSLCRTGELVSYVKKECDFLNAVANEEAQRDIMP
jgi:hypothetical protein